MMLDRPFLALVRDPTITTIVVEHTDRVTRFGFRYLETLLELSGRGFEVINLAEKNLWNLANYHTRQAFLFEKTYLTSAALYLTVKDTDA